MADSQLIFTLFPEIIGSTAHGATAAQRCNGFDKTLKAVGYLEEIFRNIHQYIPRHILPARRAFDETRRILLKLALLLRAAENPAQQVSDARTDSQSLGHTAKRAELLLEICKRLRMSNRHTNFIQFITQNQTRVSSLFRAPRNKRQYREGVTRFFMKCRDYTPDLMVHALALMMAEASRTEKEYQAFEDFFSELIHNYFSVFRPKESMPRLITGRDLIREFGLKPSPLFKSILNFIEEKRLLQENLTRIEALELIKTRLQNKTETFT